MSRSKLSNDLADLRDALQVLLTSWAALTDPARTGPINENERNGLMVIGQVLEDRLNAFSEGVYTLENRGVL
jgi:hypothetical protein